MSAEPTPQHLPQLRVLDESRASRLGLVGYPEGSTESEAAYLQTFGRVRGYVLDQLTLGAPDAQDRKASERHRHVRRSHDLARAEDYD